jgi:hypothetical protein
MNARRTRVWFLRLEGSYLRPAFDEGSAHFLGLTVPWNVQSKVSAQAQLGILLLTPDAGAGGLREYAKLIWEHADIACWLLGKPECVLRLRALSLLDDPVLRTSVCEYLEAQQQVQCGASECP